ncbi:MAG TPA: MCP four helix bundle domain-containing protein [Candidatus Saccharimonadia bacterium]|nr:MCP four helix bundle domain-containing protein [Candidatus Saccharimonadia bacterium]
MRTRYSDKGMTRMQVGAAIGLVLLLSCIVVFLVRHEDSYGLQSAFERSVKKIHIIQTMSRDLLASAEAEKSAVMADTDEASQTFAEQSSQAAQHVEKARRELEPLLGGNRQEAHLFREFSRCWDKLQEIDREVLALAVQNTNLKALRLSFVPAAEAMRRMEEALNQLIDVVSSSPDAVGITRLAAKAVMGALNIYTLQAPHIAEITATRMDEMEAVMHSLDVQVTDALQSLQARVDEPGKPFLEAAWASYKDFQNINAAIVDLSRQNSNIRSYALSLGQKRKTTAQCQDGLAALQETVQQSMMYKATR